MGHLMLAVGATKVALDTLLAIGMWSGGQNKLAVLFLGYAIAAAAAVAML